MKRRQKQAGKGGKVRGTASDSSLARYQASEEVLNGSTSRAVRRLHHKMHEKADGFAFQHALNVPLFVRRISFLSTRHKRLISSAFSRVLCFDRGFQARDSEIGLVETGPHHCQTPLPRTASASFFAPPASVSADHAMTRTSSRIHQLGLAFRQCGVRCVVSRTFKSSALIFNSSYSTQVLKLNPAICKSATTFACLLVVVPRLRFRPLPSLPCAMVRS